MAFGLLGLVVDGPGAPAQLTGEHLAAIAALAVGTTAVAFVLWYFAVGRLGSARAGLLTGVTPVAAALVGAAMGAPAPGPLVWAGIGVVAAGLALGLRGGPAGGREHPPTATSVTRRPRVVRGRR